jgi:2-dehydropantoate 2-reductase
MRIQVLGAGGIGGGLGGLLHRAGLEVTLIARGAHLEALRRDGLLLRTPRWQERLRIPVAERVQGPGLVLLAVKSQHTADVLDQLAGRRVALAQNGLMNAPVVAQVAARVHPLMVYVAAQHLKPGVVDLFGEPHPGVVDTDDAELARVLAGAGLDSREQRDLAAWEGAKLLTNLGGALQVLGRPMDQAPALWEEGRRVLHAAGLPCRPVQDLIDRVGPYSLGPIDGETRMGGSTLQDHSRGRALESRYLNGHIVDLGRAHGVPTPLNLELMTALASV